MNEHVLIIADTYRTAYSWAIQNRWELVLGVHFKHENGNKMYYVHNRESMMGFDNSTKVVVHDTWNKRPDRNELAMHMFQKGMDVWHVRE